MKINRVRTVSEIIRDCGLHEFDDLNPRSRSRAERNQRARSARRLAARLMRDERGMSLQEIASALGVKAHSTIYEWLKEKDGRSGGPAAL